jgi:hypothetical protein
VSPGMQLVPSVRMTATSSTALASTCNVHHSRLMHAVALQAALELQEERQALVKKEAEGAARRQGARQDSAQEGRRARGDRGKPQGVMSKWEDLIDEASADLERIEAHVLAASHRLVELQVGAASPVGCWHVESGQQHTQLLVPPVHLCCATTTLPLSQQLHHSSAVGRRLVSSSTVHA